MSSAVEIHRRRARGPARRRGAPVAVALALLAAACAHAGARGAGAEGWIEYRSAHFVIDAPVAARADPAQLVGEFEELHAAIAAALSTAPVEVAGAVRVVVLPSRAALAEITGSPEVRARFWLSRAGEPTLILAAEDVGELPPVVARELAHHLSCHAFPRRPRWFAEGLARFVEGVARPDAQGRRWVGADAADASAWLATGESLFAWRAGEVIPNAEATSLALYGFLWSERSAQLGELKRRLAAGEEPLDAWNAAFPEWNGALGGLVRLDEALARGQGRARPRGEVDVRGVERSFTTVPASSADVRVLLLEPGAARHDARRLREALEEVLREDPAHPAALAWRAELDGAPALPALRAAAAARPDDGVAWLWLARAAEEAAEGEGALRKSIALWPDGVLAHVYLADHLARTGRAREASPLAARAVALAPWYPAALAAAALVAGELGRCGEAVALQARAADVADAGGVGAAGFDGERLRGLVGDVRARCGGL